MLTDFSWLEKQASNEETEKLLKKLKNEYAKRYKGDAPGNTKLYCLKLGKYNLWMKECSFHSSLDMYTQIFKENKHFLVPEFYEDAHMVLDGGAHEGYYTLRVKQELPDAKVIAIEPLPTNFEIMERNFQSNCLDGIKTLNRALGKDSELDLYYIESCGSIASADLSLLLNLHPWINKNQIKKTKVKTLQLKEAVPHCDIVKLDINGAEYSLLNEEMEWFKKNVKRLIVEYHNKKDKTKIIKLLTSNGFKLYYEEEEFPGDLYLINTKHY